MVSFIRLFSNMSAEPALSPSELVKEALTLASCKRWHNRVKMRGPRESVILRAPRNIYGETDEIVAANVEMKW